MQIVSYINGDMNNVMYEINRGHKIEAIKIFRSIYNVGLKEAKDAVEAIEAGIRLAQQPATLGSILDTALNAKAQFVVFSRWEEHDYEYSRYSADDKADAMRFAEDRVNDCADTIVAQIISRTHEVVTTTRTMKAA